MNHSSAAFFAPFRQPLLEFNLPATGTCVAVHRELGRVTRVMPLASFCPNILRLPIRLTCDTHGDVYAKMQTTGRQRKREQKEGRRGYPFTLASTQRVKYKRGKYRHVSIGCKIYIVCYKNMRSSNTEVRYITSEVLFARKKDWTQV